MVTPSEPGTPARSGKVHIESVLTITPAHPTPKDLGLPRRITWDDNEAACVWEEALQSRTQLILFYKDPMTENEAAGWTLAEQLNESLRITLLDLPVFAGRFRRPDGGGFEIKCTDSGVRLVQAKVEGAPMSEFICPEARDSGMEAQLFYWPDINMRDIEFSPLFYIQLTIFPREGYSIGISSSLLLTNPLHLSDFLKTWSRIHSRMLSENKFYGIPIFHLSREQSRGGATYLENPTPRRGPKKKTKLLVVDNAAGADAHLEPKAADLLQLTSFFADAPVEPKDDGFRKPETTAVSPLVFENDACGHLRLLYCGIDCSFPQNQTQMRSQLKMTLADWEDLLGINKVMFLEQLAPLHSSCYLESGSSGELVVIIHPGNHRVETVLCATLSARRSAR